MIRDSKRTVRARSKGLVEEEETGREGASSASRTTSRRLPRFLAAIALSVLVGCAAERPGSTPPDVACRFPDHDGDVPAPKQYEGPLFKLSQSYPKSVPARGREPWKAVKHPKAQAAEYLLAVRDYFLEGMVDAKFRGQDNRVRRWYQMPWMHVGRNPRESIRGLTQERGSRKFDLGPLQTQFQQNWGTGFYNPVGGYTLGQVWTDANAPDPNKSVFLEGTVVIKVLFSAAPDEQVPDLVGSPSWTAYIRKDGFPPQPRAVRSVRLLQMDIAVKDRRAGTSGWFFGSLVYDRNASGKNGWEKLMPGGLQWGNDHGYGTANAAALEPLQETVMCDPQPVLSTYKKELGWLGRLNGPVDNPASSCMSCHSTAQWKNVAPMVADSSQESERMNWFRTLAGTDSFSPGQQALDYSLQMQLALRNFHDPSLNPSVEDPHSITGCKEIER